MNRTKRQTVMRKLHEENERLRNTVALVNQQVTKAKEELFDANTMLVMQDHATQFWSAKAPLEKRHCTILIRFINEQMRNVTAARQKSLKEIVQLLQDTLDEIPILPRDPEAEATLWFGADGRPMKIAEIPPPRLTNILRFAYRNFLDRENPQRWENLIEACEKTLKKNVFEVLRKWDRDEREKLAELMRAEEQRRALPEVGLHARILIRRPLGE